MYAPWGHVVFMHACLRQHTRPKKQRCLLYFPLSIQGVHKQLSSSMQQQQHTLPAKQLRVRVSPCSLHRLSPQARNLGDHRCTASACIFRNHEAWMCLPRRSGLVPPPHHSCSVHSLMCGSACTSQSSLTMGWLHIDTCLGTQIRCMAPFRVASRARLLHTSQAQRQSCCRCNPGSGSALQCHMKRSNPTMGWPGMHSQSSVQVTACWSSEARREVVWGWGRLVRSRPPRPEA